MKTLFISDLHLSAKRPDISELFFYFLDNYAAKADVLYILGDFFEVWVGIDVLNEHELRILKALKQYIASGKSVYFMHGNRDFLIDKQFEAQTGAVLISEPYILSVTNVMNTLNELNVEPNALDRSIAENRWVLCHGDTLCTLDTSYQRFRAFVRHPWIKAFYLSLPEFIRRKIANKLRSKSKTYQQKFVAFPEKWDVTAEAVEDILKKHKASVLLHGHTHKTNIHDILIDNVPHKRIVLGDWGKTGNFLELEDGLFQYKIFNENGLLAQ